MSDFLDPSRIRVKMLLIYFALNFCAWNSFVFKAILITGGVISSKKYYSSFTNITLFAMRVNNGRN